jgi:DNA-binding NarL/FixJ family response regulator
MNVLIVDDHPVVLEYVTSAVKKALPDAVIRTAGDLTTALALAGEVPMNLVLLDLGLPGCGGLDSIVRFRKAFPDVRVLVVSSNDDEQSIFGALGVGAAGFVPKTAGPKTLLQALKVVVQGERFIPQEFLASQAARQPAAGEKQGAVGGRKAKP